MKKTLQDQYLLIKEGKGHKGVFLADAKREFPQYVRNAATYDEAIASLKTKSVISENFIGFESIVGHEPKKKESYETAFESFLAEAKKKQEEDEKAELKKTSKQVEEDLGKNFDYSDDKNPDNLIFDQIMMGYYAEMKDPKNANKTMQQLKDIVLKNLAKDPIHYTKEGQFGVKDLGYTTEHPGLGTPKEPKGKYASSGYGNLNENKELNVGDKVKYRGTNVTVEKKDEVGNLVLKTESGKTIRANKAQFKEYGSLEEEKLRKAIQEMIDTELEEAYQLVNIRPRVSDKEREERDPQQFITVYLTSSTEELLKKNQYLRVLRNPKNPEEVTGVAIRSTLLSPQNLKKLPYDINPMFNSFLNTANNIGGTINLPTKEGVTETYTLLNNVNVGRDGKLSFKTPNPKFQKPVGEAAIGVRDTDVSPGYPVDLPISYSDDKNVAHYSDDYRYSSQDDLLDVEDYLEQIQGMSDRDAFNYLEELGLERDEILTVLKRRKSSLREGVEKELAAINKEAEHEILQSKLEKIQELIDKKQSQLGKLDEDEDMKALTDDKKVKEISKDIKSLEKAKAKLEKMMHKGKSKSPRKEVIDETDEILDEAEGDLDPAELDKAEKSIKSIQSLADKIAKTELFEEEPEESEEY
jgi:hypothetical protein